MADVKEVRLPFDGDLVINVLAVLVERAGGEIIVKQSEFDSILGAGLKCFGVALEDPNKTPDDYIRITNSFVSTERNVRLLNRDVS